MQRIFQTNWKMGKHLHYSVWEKDTKTIVICTRNMIHHYHYTLLFIPWLVKLIDHESHYFSINCINAHIECQIENKRYCKKVMQSHDSKTTELISQVSSAISAFQDLHGTHLSRGGGVQHFRRLLRSVAGAKLSESLPSLPTRGLNLGNRLAQLRVEDFEN